MEENHRGPERRASLGRRGIAPDQPGNARRSAKPSTLLDILLEIQRFFVEERDIIFPLTVQEILEEQIGMKLV